VGALNKTFMTNINSFIKLDVPVQAQFKDSQTFSSNLDKIQELNEEILEIKKQAEKLATDCETKQTALRGYITAVTSKIDQYDKSRENLLKVMKKDENSAGIAACNGLGVALNQVEGYTKDPIGLKVEITVKG
jgi:chromosome segregation ATPase